MSAIKLKSNPIKTVLVITVGLLIIYLFTKSQWLLFASVIIGSLGVLSNKLARMIDFVWMKLTWLLSKIIPNILLALVFYLFLTPIALISRIFGEKNQLGLKDIEKSMFKNIDKDIDPSSLENPW
ncbi:MAG: hypothetical protein ABFR05_12475 [Bacteroidota bacterium]